MTDREITREQAETLATWRPMPLKDATKFIYKEPNSIGATGGHPFLFGYGPNGDCLFLSICTPLESETT